MSKPNKTKPVEKEIEKIISLGGEDMKDVKVIRTKPEFMMLARKMFDGQFPNEIRMNVPKFDWSGTEEKKIKEELWDWFRTSIEKYDEFLSELTKLQNEK